MSELFKGVIISFVVFLLWSAGCFWCGYVLSDRRATDRINDANKQLAEQQQKYDELIRLTNERIRESDEQLQNFRKELYAEMSNAGKTTDKLAELIEQIRKQKLDI